MRVNKYDLMRKRADQESGAQTQQETDALARRFASQGIGGSGAAIKQEQMAFERGAQRVDKAKEGINMAEADELGRIEEADKGRQFQAGENALARRFASEEAGIARQFQTSERQGSQAYQSLERQAQEAFQRGEADKGRELQQQAMTMQADQFAQTFEAAKKQFDLDAYISYQNLVTARGGNAMVLPPELLERLGLSKDFFGSASEAEAATAEDQFWSGAQNAGRSSKNAFKNPDPIKSIKKMFGGS